MTGAHRLPGRRAVSAAKSARWLLAMTLLAVVPLALAGLVVYLAVIGTGLEVWAVVWVIWAGVLARAILRRDRGAAWVWAGPVVVASWYLVSAVARHAGWPDRAQHLLAVTGDWLWAPLTALFGVAVFRSVRSGSFPFPLWRSSNRDRQG